MKKQQSDALRASDLDDRFTSLEELAYRHSHELQIQFDRIAQLQADFDILRGGILHASGNRAETFEPLDDVRALTDEADRGATDIPTSSMSFKQRLQKPINWLRDVMAARPISSTDFD